MSFFKKHFFLSRFLPLGFLSAILFVSFLTGILPALLLTFLSPFPLFISGLREGVRSLMFSVIAGCLCALIFAGVEVSVLYLFIIGLPVYLLVVAALKKDGESLTVVSQQKARDFSSEQAELLQESRRVSILVLTHQLYGLLLLTAFFVFFMKVVDAAAIKTLLSSFLSAYKSSFDDKAIDAFYKMLPGGCASAGMIVLLLNGIGAQQVLKGQGRSLSKPIRLDLLTLPFWPWILLAVAGIISFAFPEALLGIYARNVLLVLRVLFLLQGLSVAHVFAKTKPYGKGFLVSLYFFTFVIDWLGLLIAGLGILEPWIKIRQRLKNQE